MARFDINGREASWEEFVRIDHVEPELPGEEYYCEYAQTKFTPIEATQIVLSKYGITIDEYKEVAIRLEKLLSLTGCKLCF